MHDSINAYVPNPVIWESTGRETRQYDVFSRLLKDRIIFLGTQIDDTVANLIIAQLLFSRWRTRRRTSTFTSIRRADM